MRDGPLLRAVKHVALLCFRLDVAASRALRRARGERPWQLAGACQRHAACCEAPAFSAGLLLWSVPLFSHAFLAWQRHVNGFALAGREQRARTFVFRCSHFDPLSRACDSYDSRPGICRDYPRILLWSGNPEFLPGCGHRGRPPNADGLRRALAALELTPQQRTRLRDGLRIDD